jgi:hypothetical protein
MFFYYFKIIRPFLLLKLNYQNNKELSFIRHLTLSIYIKDIKNSNDTEIINSYILLEYLTKLLPKLKYFTNYEKKKRILCVLCFVTLSNNHLFFFLNFFINFLIKYMKKKNIKILKQKLNNLYLYTFNINDLSIFYFLPFSFYN